MRETNAYTLRKHILKNGEKGEANDEESNDDPR